MTMFSLVGDDPVVAPHVCTSDLSRLQKHEHLMWAWQCSECRNPVFIEEVVEMLRERAVAQDAASQVHRLRGTEEPVEFTPVTTPKLLREQGGL